MYIYIELIKLKLIRLLLESTNRYSILDSGWDLYMCQVIKGLDLKLKPGVGLEALLEEQNPTSHLLKREGMGFLSVSDSIYLLN